MSPRPTLDPSDGAVYQSGLYSNDNQETLTLSGLGGELEANQSYQLYLFGASVFFSSQSNGQTLTVSSSFGTLPSPVPRISWVTATVSIP